MDANTKFLTQLADTAQIQSHRLQETVGKAPELEIEMALANIGLDLLGQCRYLYQRVATVSGSEEDQVALGRDSWDMYNVLLAEIPNTDFAQIIAKNFFLSHFTHLLYTQLLQSTDDELKAFATKSLKELDYHTEYFNNWILRLGDGTEYSHQMMKQAILDTWDYVGEFFTPVQYETEMDSAIFPIDFEKLRSNFQSRISHLLEEATVDVPETTWSQQGGKVGKHSEHMGYILADTRYMQLSYPGMKW